MSTLSIEQGKPLDAQSTVVGDRKSAMIGEEAQRSTAEPGTPERLDGADDPVSSKDAKVAAEAMARDEFEAAWAALGPEASAAIAGEVARVSAQSRDGDSNEAAAPREREADEGSHERTSPQSIDDDERTPSRPRDASPRPAEARPVREAGAPRARAPRVRSSPPPPPPPAKPTKPSAHAPVATKSPAAMPVEKEGEPDLLALSEAHARTAALAGPPPQEPLPQVIRVVEAPRSTERKLLVALVVLLVVVNGYFLVKQQMRTPEAVVDARPVVKTEAPMNVREAAVASPRPADAAPPVAAPRAEATPIAEAAPVGEAPPPAEATPPADATPPAEAKAPVDAKPPAEATPPVDAKPVATPAPVDEPVRPRPAKPKKPKAPRALPDKPEPRGTLPDKPEPGGTLPDKPEPGAAKDAAPAEAKPTSPEP